MGAVLVVIFILIIVLAAVAGPIVFLRSRKTLREQKNYERGLKMVPLLIHLPPPSEDMQTSGRDQRDITDESISKAQVIYNIISSTLQKGFKAKFYGQRHFGFEIIGTHGFVYFYASVPIALADVVKQAVVSAYPAARLEEVAEHNIFNPVGKITSTVGGEMNLKSSFAYPIATYQDLKRDAMQSLLNALSTLDKEDGAAIQILMRPADPAWRKVASGLASKKRKGKEGKGNGAEAFTSGLKQFVTAFIKPPEGGGKDEEKPPKELSALEQQVLDSIDDKTRYPGYEVLIRVVASSNISSRAQAVLQNINATFALYDAPGKNGFKFTPAKDVDEFVTSYILRFFPQKKRKNILNVVELATLFHFPDQQDTPTSQLTRQMSKQVDGPRNMPEDGMLLGYNLFRGVKKPIRLALNDRQRHMYAVGQTGTGKSTFLENLALQDMIAGNGFAFIDPHGDTAEKLLAMVPKERTEDVIYFSPADMEYPMGLNLFEFNDPDQKDFLIQETLNMLYKLYDPQHQGIMGPRYEHLFRMAALTIMADPAGGTFVDIPKLFRDTRFVDQKLEYVKDQNVIEFWKKEIPQSQRSNDFGEVVSWFVSKFGAFLSNEMMRNIIGQTKSAFDLRDIMDNKKILLVNLSKGRTGDLNSKLLGMIFVMKFQAAAMSRASIPEDKRVDFCLYVDEFQNFSTDSFATIMSEARKYHLNLIVANQFTTQLTEEIRDAVFGNMGTIVAFRVGQNDVDSLTKYFQPTFDADDLLRVPNYNAIVRTLVGGVPTNPFSMVTLPPLGNPNMQLAGALKQLSAAKFGKPRAVVEKEIFARMATKADAAPLQGGVGGQPAFGGPRQSFGAAASPSSPFGSPAGPGGFGGAPAARPGPSVTPGGSFLDDWLAKRQGPPSGAMRPAPIQPAAGGAPMSPFSPASAPLSSPSPFSPAGSMATSPAPGGFGGSAAGTGTPWQSPATGSNPPAGTLSPPVPSAPTFGNPSAAANSGIGVKGSAEASDPGPAPLINKHKQSLRLEPDAPSADTAEAAGSAYMEDLPSGAARSFTEEPTESSDALLSQDGGREDQDKGTTAEAGDSDAGPEPVVTAEPASEIQPEREGIDDADSVASVSDEGGHMVGMNAGPDPVSADAASDAQVSDDLPQLPVPPREAAGSAGSASEEEEDDTISIDQDGNMQFRDSS